MNRLSIVTTVFLVAAMTAAPVAAANTVRSIDIVDGEVKTPDLARSAVTNKKLASNSVNGAKLAENTLGVVPNADNLDGRNSTSFVGGAARIFAGQASINRGAFGAIFTAAFADEIGFNVAYQCPGGSPAVPGKIEFRNKSGTAWQVWYQDGGDEPVFIEVAGLGNAQFGATEQFHSVKIRLARKFATGQATVYFSVNDALTTCKANGLVMLFS